MKYIELARVFHPLVTDGVIVESCCCSDYNGGGCKANREWGCEECFNEEVPAETVESFRALMRDRYMVVVFAKGSILGILPSSDDRQLSATLLACDNNTNTSGYIACERDEEGGWTPIPRPRVVQIVKAAADQLRRESGGET